MGIIGSSYDGYLPLVAQGAEPPGLRAFWQSQAVDIILAQQAITVPTLLVHSWLDRWPSGCVTGTDVLTCTTGVLTAPVKISGELVAHLLAATSGADADWLVKLIDADPDQVPSQPEMGGYQLMISAGIFHAQPADYKKASQRIYHDSYIELPLVGAVVR